MTFHISLFDLSGKLTGCFSIPELSTAIRCAAHFSSNFPCRTKIEVFLTPDGAARLANIL